MIIFFDADDTLYRLNRPASEIYALVLARNGVHVDQKALDKSLSSAWLEFQPTYLATADGHNTDIQKDRKVWFDFIDSVVKKAGIGQIPRALAQEIYDEFKDPAHRSLFPGTEETLRSLRGLGHKTGILSNHDLRIRDVMEGLGIMPLVDYCFTAGELGWKKPAQSFFHEAQKRVGVRGKGLVYVGNDPYLDYKAAVDAGCRGIWFNPKNRPTPFSEITQVQQLPQILDLIGLGE